MGNPTRISPVHCFLTWHLSEFSYFIQGHNLHSGGSAAPGANPQSSKTLTAFHCHAVTGKGSLTACRITFLRADPGCSSRLGEEHSPCDTLGVFHLCGILLSDLG